MPQCLSPEIYARELLKGLNISNIPVNPLDICRYFNIEVCYDDLQQCEAVLIIRNGSKKIILSSNTTYHLRQKFSVAHELGHYYMPHHNLQLFACSASDIMAFENNSLQEREANLFAGELLMPYEHIIKDAKFYEYSVESIKELANKYGVSITAAAVRFLKVTPDRAALVLSENGTVKWSMKSKNFIYYIKKTIDSATYIYDFYHNGSMNESLNKTYAGAWLEDPGNLDVINEQSIVMPFLNMALTILTVPFKEDDYCDDWLDQ